MKKKLVYDSPTRVFHWTFAALFVTAFTIAKTIDSESSNYPYHMLAGLTLSFSVMLRVLWGFVGTRYARFESFALAPQELVNYFKGILKRDNTHWAGHNPASSWAAILMMALALGLGVTGVLMASGGDKEVLEEIHEIFANSFFVVAVVHVTGVALHTFRFKELIGLSMLNGMKENVSDIEAISLPRIGFGVVFGALVFFYAVFLLKHFEPRTKKLEVLGVSLQLGEISKNDNHGEDD